MTQSAETRNPDASAGGPGGLQALVEEYLTSLREQQLEKCLSLFADDATIEFQAGVFKGPKAIEEWHRDRFAAGFQILDVERMTVDGNTVTIEAAIASARLKAWKINRLSGQATIAFENGRIKEARLTPKLYNPFEGW
jgi:uncharacterized protein (TIGR02246 family)